VLPTGTQTYSLEFFVYVNGVSGSYNILVEGSTSANGFQITYFNDGSAQQGKLGVSASGVGAIVTATFSSYFNRWVHVVATRSGNDHRLFFDGVLVAYASNAISFAARGTQSFGAQASGALPMNGYMSNVRACLGSIPTSYQTSSTTVSTIIFSVPTESLTNTSQGATSADVELRTCQSNCFVDNSGNNYTLNTGGTPSVQAFSPFNPSASWSAATYGGSGYFDGNTDYLTVPQSAGALDLGSGQFSLEFWWYPTSVSGTIIPFIGDSTGNWYVGQEAGNIVLGRRSTALDVNTTGFTLVANTWQHIVVTRQSTSTNDTRIFVNGVLRGVGTTSQNYTITTTLNIGGLAGGYVTGYLSSTNLVKGSVPAAYQTSNTTTGTQIFTPPTSPSTSVTGTQLLLNYTNGGIYDATSKNDLETVGNAQISTAISAKWGTGSMYFNGTNPQHLLLNYPPTQNALNGAFTIDFWIYWISGTGVILSSDEYVSLIAILSTGKIEINTASSPQSTGTISANTWTYLAFTRNSSGVWTLYINGSADPLSLTNTSTYTLRRIGGRSADNCINGYLQDFRVTKGYVRAITTPTSAFPTQ